MPAILLLLACLMAGPAAAGAWLKEERAGFVSLSYEGIGETTWTGLFAEYGWSDDLTLGLNAGRGIGDRRLSVFARGALPYLPEPNRLAWQLGAGLRGGMETPVVEAGLSFGRPIRALGRDGWVNADLTVAAVGHLDRIETDGTVEIDHEAKFDFVAGLRDGPWTATAELRIFTDEAGTTATLIPAISRDLGVAELRVGVRLGDSDGFAIAVSRSF